MSSCQPRLKIPAERAGRDRTPCIACRQSLHGLGTPYGMVNAVPTLTSFAGMPWLERLKRTSYKPKVGGPSPSRRIARCAIVVRPLLKSVMLLGALEH